MKKVQIVISPRFCFKAIPPEAKWFLVDILHKSKDYKLAISTYTDIANKYKDYNTDPSCYFNNRVYKLSNDQTEIVFDKEALKHEGIYIREYNKVRKIVEVDPDKVQKLLFAYNSVRDHKYMVTEGHVVFPVIAKDTSMVYYKKLIDFLEANRIEDWYLYFYSIFRSYNWTISVSLRKMYLPDYLDRYNNWKDRSRDELNTAHPIVQTYTKSKWLGIFEHIEQVKQKFLNNGKAEVCLSNIGDTLGYHPLSEACKGCPVKGRCQKEIYLKFQKLSNSSLDIVRLRGNISMVEKAQKELEDSGSSFKF